MSLCRLCIQKVINFLTKILYIILSIIISLIFPIVLLSVIPVYIIRWLIASYAKHFKHDLGKILSVRSSIYAIDTLNKKNSVTLLVLLVVEGDLTSEEFKEILERRLLNKKQPGSSSSNEFLHVEMKQYITQWMGFYFWKPESNFNLDEHVHTPPTEPSFNEETMLAYNTNLIENSYGRKRSPWEFHLVRNYKPFGRKEDFSLTGIVFRCHHALADGYSVLNLMTCSSDDKFGIAKPARVQLPTSMWKTCLDNVMFPFRVPYEIVKVSLESYDFNDLKLPAHKLTRRLTTGYHPLIPLSRLKDIKNYYGVTLTTVLLEIFAGTLRNFMLQNGMKVPETLHCITPLPLPGHSEKLRNYATACFTELPVGTSDPVKRLYQIENHLKGQRQSTIPWSASILFQIAGGLFPFMAKHIARSLIGTAVMANFPGPDRKVNFFSRPMHELNFGGSLFRGRLSIGMTSITYNGMVSMLIGMDKALCPNWEDKAILVDLIRKEIEVLESLMTTTTTTTTGLQEV